MLWVDEFLDRLGEALYITTLDLTKGYWQIPLELGSKEKTSFATPNGVYQFTRMPFGLRRAPVTFQRLMDHLLLAYAEYAAAYLNDIVIYRSCWEDHLNQVTAVLWTLWSARLTANSYKDRSFPGNQYGVCLRVQEGAPTSQEGSGHPWSAGPT